MSWANVRELILQERKVLGQVDLPATRASVFANQQNQLLASYLDTKSSVDDAIRQFARSFEWPELSGIQRFFVAARLDYAWEIASVLNTCHDRSRIIDYPELDESKPSEILEWLLIDIWPYACGRFLQSRRQAAEQTANWRKAEKRSRLPQLQCLV
jgi:hypothetical protein